LVFGVDETGIIARRKIRQIVLEHLDPSSMLLMYLTEELSPAEQAEVRKRLAADPSLQRELDELQNVQHEFDHAMSGLDAADPLIGQASAVVRISRAMRQHKVNRVAVEYKLPARSISLWQRVPRWTYPLAAAAALGLIYIGWWTFQPADNSRPYAINPTTQPSNDSMTEAQADVDGVEQNLRNTNRTQPDEMRELRQVERQVADLSDTNSNLMDGLLSQHIGLPDNE
jgi:hypothetical protein